MIHRTGAAAAAATAIAALVAFVATACGDDDDGARSRATASPALAAGVTVVYREVQCFGNPWERDWLDAHPGDPFPTHDPARKAIFEEYWRNEGIDVTDVRRESFLKPGDVVCQACTCPTGFEWRVRIPPDDASAALARGFAQPR